MRLRLLGPIEVAIDGVTVAAGPPKQQLVLALLASRPGRVVSTAELVEELWNGTPPPSAAVNLRTYIHGLRRILGPESVTGHGRPGYVLALPAGAFDIEEFLAAAQRGEATLSGGEIGEARSSLHRALALWRGSAFEGFEDVAALRAPAAELEERRLVALEQRIDADLYSGAAGELVVELSGLAAEHPFRERFHAQLMVALNRSGRQADALAAFRTARNVLRRDLGIEPGIQLRELELSILRGDAGDPWNRTTAPEEYREIPSELPIVVSQFACREAELERLDAVAPTAGRSSGARIAAIVGPGGVGKTALTVYWAHHAVARFPDGQIFLDLRGFHTAGPVPPADALARILRALGVAADRVPPGLDEAAALYRSLLSGRRMLVVMDNAVSAEQVRPLLPAGPGCMALVTSRNSLVGLVAREAAVLLSLRPLSVPEGVRLLEGVLTAERVREELDAAGELVEACGGLPLALRITAANLAAQDGRRIAEHVTELRSGQRLDRLRNEGDEQLSVRAAFDLSYAALTEGPRRLFALIGLVPGPDVTAETAAALAGATVAETELQLDQLAAAHLLERVVQNRYAPHDLAREYAAEQALAGDHGEALGRLLAHYSDHATDAAHVLYPQFLRLVSEPPRAGDFDVATAAGWFGAELANLVAACEHAAEHGPYEPAWLIADALRGYCQYKGNTTDWAKVARAAASAADRAGELRPRAAAAISLGHCCYTTRDYAGALTHLQRALDLSQRAKWPEAEASVLGNLAATYGMLGEMDRVAEHLRSALEINRRVGFRRGETVSLSNLGLTSLWLGRLADAESYLLAAIELCRKDGATPMQAVAQSYLIELLLLTARYEEAEELIEEAIGYSQEAGRVTAEVQLLVYRAALHRLAGDAPAALSWATQAYKLVEETGDRLLTGNVHLALASAHVMLDRPDEAAVHQRAALRLAADIQGRYLHIEALIGLAESTHAVSSSAPAAEETGRAALAQARSGGFRVLEGQALAVLATIASRRGDGAAAAAYAEQALAVEKDTGWAARHSDLVLLSR